MTEQNAAEPADEQAACGVCGGGGQVYDGPRIVWRPCPICTPRLRPGEGRTSD